MPNEPVARISYGSCIQVSTRAYALLTEGSRKGTAGSENFPRKILLWREGGRESIFLPFPSLGEAYENVSSLLSIALCFTFHALLAFFACTMILASDILSLPVYRCRVGFLCMDS